MTLRVYSRGYCCSCSSVLLMCALCAVSVTTHVVQALPSSDNTITTAFPRDLSRCCMDDPIPLNLRHALGALRQYPLAPSLCRESRSRLVAVLRNRRRSTVTWEGRRFYLIWVKLGGGALRRHFALVGGEVGHRGAVIALAPRQDLLPPGLSLLLPCCLFHVLAARQALSSYRFCRCCCCFCRRRRRRGVLCPTPCPFSVLNWDGGGAND